MTAYPLSNHYRSVAGRVHQWVWWTAPVGARRAFASAADRRALDRSGCRIARPFVLCSRHEARASRPRYPAHDSRPRCSAAERDPASARSYHHTTFARRRPCPARDRPQVHSPHARPAPVCCPATRELPRFQDRSALGSPGEQRASMLQAALSRGSCRASRSHRSWQAALPKCAGFRAKRVATLAANLVADVAGTLFGEVASGGSLIDCGFGLLRS
jgi:hypothetical protein